MIGHGNNNYVKQGGCLFLNPEKEEINHHTGKFILGIMVLSMAGLTSFFSDGQIESVSASYYADYLPRDIFVGFLFAMFAFMFAYNGKSKLEMILSKTAAVSALLVAIFPCKCETHPELIPGLHGTFSAIMFLILAIFCYLFFKRAWSKGHSQAKLRAYIYAGCGIAIIAAILTLVIDSLLDGAFTKIEPRLMFYSEQTGLIAFGVAWLCASRSLPIITSTTERCNVFK